MAPEEFVLFCNIFTPGHKLGEEGRTGSDPEKAALATPTACGHFFRTEVILDHAHKLHLQISAVILVYCEVSIEE